MPTQRKLFLILGGLGIAAATAALSLTGLVFAQTQGATVAACICSGTVEVNAGTNPTSPRGWITNCQCGAQSCAVLNTQTLYCSK